MPIPKFKMFSSLMLAISLLAVSASLAIAQDTTAPHGARTVASGQKMKIKGVVVRRDMDTFVVRDINGVDTTVRLDDRTSVKTKGGFLRSGANYGQTQILRGLNLEIEGRGDSSGNLLAEKVRFNESDLRVARAVESRAAPLETKVSEVEQNAQRLSGQLDELAAVANTAKGGAKAAQETADAAVQGVNVTNERISALDDYVPQTVLAVNFRTGSAVLSPDSKTKLDEIATTLIESRRRLSVQDRGAPAVFAKSSRSVPPRRIVRRIESGCQEQISG